ncbi:hypothetical protein B0H21DRAFT_15981 [Amylocystis lapponica]|nr:hypothetical protein B0H21DRAFT_15981 [Amylocystis lapponica]
MMMPPTSLQARINAFEALNAQNNVSRSPPNLLERPISPAVTSFSPIIPSNPSTPVKSPSSRSPSPSPPNLGRKTSLLDLKDWVLDDGPVLSAPRPTLTGHVNGTSGVAMNGHVPKPPPRHVSDSVLPSSAMSMAPLISFEAGSPPRTRPAPPLPPRKPSYNSLRSASASAANSSTSSLSRSPVQPTTALPPPTRKPSDTLSVDTTHTYPPPGTLGIAIPSRGHVPASSISSFHSVSLSSDGGTEPATPASSFIPVDGDEARNAAHDPDSKSLDESFENVSASTISPSVTSVARDWEAYARREPPKLPQRPKSTKSPTSPPRPPTTASTSSHLSTLLKQQPPPPAPYRPRTPSSRTSTSASTSTTPSASLSDRSSILSTATTATSYTNLSATSSVLMVTPKPKQAQLTRPTPMPSVARRRYEALFERTVEMQRRTASASAGKAKRPPPAPPANRKHRQAAGWRGLSVDLLVTPEDVEKMGSTTTAVVEEGIAEEEPRLDGEAVKRIWACSRLERRTLRAIWSECDPGGTGELDRAAFAQGMWRIDEELRRAELQRAIGTTRYGSGAAVRARQPKRADTLLLR